ncbi:hypothetical protein HK104_006605 [Borealophlyctis nickersoniae]|nr:hypothetical protein HK104_006605 [Borealophlyctis nickersoniae]
MSETTPSNDTDFPSEYITKLKAHVRGTFEAKVPGLPICIPPLNDTFDAAFVPSLATWNDISCRFRVLYKEYTSAADLVPAYMALKDSFTLPAEVLTFIRTDLGLPHLAESIAQRPVSYEEPKSVVTMLLIWLDGPDADTMLHLHQKF